MGLPAVPTRHQDSSAHRQRIAEVVNGITSFQFDDSRVRTPAEIEASVTPVNYAYDPGIPIRYGATGDGSADDTAAVQAAVDQFFEGGAEVRLAGKSYRLTAPIEFDGQHIRITGPGDFIIDHTGDAFVRASGGTAARMKFANFRVLARQNAADAFDMDQWQYCEFDNIFVGSETGSADFDRAFYLHNVSYWNVMKAVEVEAAPIAWEFDDANDNYFLGCRHVRFSGTATNTVKFSGGCSGVRFYGVSCENVYASASVISFHSACEQCMFVGGRIEARTGSTSVLPIDFNGAGGNYIIGMYVLGAGITNITDTIGNNEVLYYTVSGFFRYMGTGVLRLPTTVGSPGNAGEVMYDSTAGLFRGHASGSSRNFVQTPAIENLDMNGNTVSNAANVVLSAVAGNPGANKIALGSTTATTVGAAGGASAPPATPTKYWIVNEGGTLYKIPLYAN